ncbi:MAG: hypothetical protein IKQ99_01920 [Alphaproteobacteria bacterium]|nr:hypothetical protein [Alphaproteobacteria bacterium]
MRLLYLILFLSLATPVWAISESSATHVVKKATEVKSDADLPQLVKSLTRGVRTDKDKAYVLLTWIVKNIDYDDYKKRQVDKKAYSRYSRTEIPAEGDILKTRLGVCEDIADLYKRMLEEAEMKAVVINGCTGETDRKGNCADGSAGHAWNAVWIDNQWEFVDPTFAITGGNKNAMEDVTRKSKYERELKKREKKFSNNYEVRKGRSVNKQWFMTDPQVMQNDHHPQDKKWLLLKVKDRRNKNL